MIGKEVEEDCEFFFFFLGSSFPFLRESFERRDKVRPLCIKGKEGRGGGCGEVARGGA